MANCASEHTKKKIIKKNKKTKTNSLELFMIPIFFFVSSSLPFVCAYSNPEVPGETLNFYGGKKI